MDTSLREPALVLAVNDNEVARYVLSLILKRAGHRVLEAATGREALAHIHAHRPDLVVLDVQLPDISGLEVCAEVRRDPKVSSTKILHTSATFVSTESKVQALREGADGYLTQPYESEELTAMVDALLRLSRTEEELRATAEQLREADRRKDEFLAMLAHELRNPLAAIWAALPLLDDSPARDEKERVALSVLQRQSTQLKRLIDDLLDVSRVTQGKVGLRHETVELNRLIGQVADNLQRTALVRRKQTLEITLSDEPLYVRGDPVRLEQVFANLLDNASKYTPEAGHIWLETSKQGVDGTSSAHITIRDDGVGMDPETLPRIFALFVQADVPLARSSGGLGIGLTLVRSLVELHHGTVSVHSDGLDRGSTFRVELPCAPPKYTQAAARQERESPEGDPTHLVLLVEDNEDLQMLTASRIEAWGHVVQCASDGLTGLEMALAEQPDVVVLDIGLPGIDGYQLAERLRESGSEALLIGVTGYSEAEKRNMALRSGCDHVLVKPVDPAALRRLLRESRRRERDTLAPPAPTPQAGLS